MPMQPAILGTARLGNFRLGYIPAALAAIRRTTVTILLAGLDARIRISGLTIQDVLNDVPNTCSLVVDDATPPTVDQELRIAIGTSPPRPLFVGTLQTVALAYEGEEQSNRVWPCTAIDHTARLNRRRPFGTFVNVSATTIAQTLVTTFAPAFNTTHVDAGLPLVSIIFDGTTEFIGCLSQLATAIGGYCKVEDLDVYLFLEDTSDPPDAIDTTPDRFLNDPPITVSIDASQLRTRVCGKGHGEPVVSDVLAGETIIPIADAVMFNPLGGLVMAGTTPEGAQSQRLTYTGITLGGGGSLVGPGAAPSTAPTLALAAGTGLGIGVYQYAVVDVTPSGKSLPSPMAGITTIGPSTVADPTLPPQSVSQSDSPAHYGSGGSAPNFNATTQPPYIGDVVEYAYSWSTSAANDLLHETNLSPPSAPITVGQALGTPGGWTVAKLVSMYVQYAAPPAGVTYTHVWRRRNGGSWNAFASGGILTGLTALNGYVVQDSAYTDGIHPPTANATVPARQQVSVASIAIGAGATTARELYRTAVNGSQLKFLTTIANNNTLGPYLDSVADGSLGANVPASDTSALTQPSGQVLAGAASIPVAGPGAFDSAGGWVRIGSQVVRFTGVNPTTGSLVGVPPTGPGALIASVAYNATVMAVPALLHVPPTGIGALLLPMLMGTPVHIWVQRDDLAAQAEQTAIDVANGVTDGNGIYEGPPIVDERRGEASLIAICDANLQLFSRPIVTFTYGTRDMKTRSGKTVHIELPGYPVGDYVIQDVTITELGISPGLAPRFAVTASTVRFSLDDILRRLVTAQAV